MSEKVADSDSLVLDASPQEEIVTIKWADALRQIIASCSAYAIVIQGGANLAFSAVLLPQLAADDSDLYVNTDEASWIASLVTLSTLAVALIVGPLMDKFGRKNIALFTCLPFIISWILIATAKNVAQLYVARILAGAGAGFSCVSLVYISEICHTSFRPMLLSLNSVAVSLGILLTCALGVICSWRTLAWIYFVMSILSMIVLFPLPESPHWLATFSKDETLPLNKISKSLRWLYKNPQIYEQQYSELLSNADKRALGASTETGLAGFIQVYSKPTVYKPIIILVIIFLFQQFAGSYVIIFYALDIFRKITGDFDSILNEYVSLVLLGAIRLILTMACALLSKRCGRKLMMYVSGIGMSVSTFGIVLHSALADKDCHPSLSFLPALFLLLYVCFCSLGYLVIPWGLIGELLPVKVRGTMGGVLIMWAYACMFFAVKMFPSLIESVGVSSVFAFFSAVSFGSVLYVFFFLPETFGKRFSEIEDYFNNSNERNFS